MITKNARHRKDEAKARGMIEIGNENPEKIHETAEKTRKERYDERWNDDRFKVYD